MISFLPIYKTKYFAKEEFKVIMLNQKFIMLKIVKKPDKFRIVKKFQTLDVSKDKIALSQFC